jgi:phosphoribosylanthranilate isomerase
VILAGGLAPDNVAEAIRIARPVAVDASSSLEAVLGRKDPAKVEAFFRAVAQAGTEPRQGRATHAAV